MDYETFKKEPYDIVFAGTLYKLKQIPIEKKADTKGWYSMKWKHRYVVLRRTRISKVGIIDYYENESAFKNSRRAKGTLCLFPNFRVIRCTQLNTFSQTKYDKEFVLELLAQDKILRMAAESSPMLDIWLQKIQRTAILRPTSDGRLFTVQPCDSPAMRRIGVLMTDKYFLWLCSSGIILAEQELQSIVAIWSYRCLRIYRIYGDNQFVFEAGRRSLLGQGEYTFYTKDSENIEIATIIGNAIQFRYIRENNDMQDSVQEKLDLIHSDYSKMDGFIEYSVGFNQYTPTESSSLAVKNKQVKKVGSKSFEARVSQPIPMPVHYGIHLSTSESSLSSSKNEWTDIRNMTNNAAVNLSASSNSPAITTTSSICSRCQTFSEPNPMYNETIKCQHRRSSNTSCIARKSCESDGILATSRSSQDTSDQNGEPFSFDDNTYDTIVTTKTEAESTSTPMHYHYCASHVKPIEVHGSIPKRECEQVTEECGEYQEDDTYDCLGAASNDHDDCHRTASNDHDDYVHMAPGHTKEL